MIINKCEDFYQSTGCRLHEAINLYYTYQCNIQCDHCCYNCGPHRTEHMDMDDAKRILKGAASSGTRLVELLGGELFLDYEALAELIEYASGIGLAVNVDTNGFWGRTVETAKAKLSELSVCGLKRINVSIDTFHQKFIPLEYSLNIIRAARELGIFYICSFCLSSDSEKDHNLLSDLKKEAVDIFTINPTPDGRSACLMPVPVLELGSCKLLGINITVNGDTFICCGHSDQNKDITDTPLYMGNCIQEKPESVLEKKNLLRLQAFFDPNSPIWFKKFLEREPYKKVFENKRFSHICELCKDMLYIEEINRNILEFNPSDK